MDEASSGEVLLYQRDDGTPDIEVRLEQETVWMCQRQIAELFGTTRENITLHLHNVFDEGELVESVTSKESSLVRSEGSPVVRRKVLFYNLDAIMSVGYRVKSMAATQFRIWATERLRDVLVKGYAVDEKRLEQLGQIEEILDRSDDELVSGAIDILSEYLPRLIPLRDFDEGRIEADAHVDPHWELTLDEARSIIHKVAAEFPSDDLLGQGRDEGLAGIIGTTYQSFGGQEVYPTAEGKAANLFYFFVKDHPLSDGKKRGAAALFVTFLARNGHRYGLDGVSRMSSNALTTITLLVAMSKPLEKDLMVSLLVRMIGEKTK
ncbi:MULTISPECIES: RhuM family protein [Corynebacterium]|uniref:RhuM family protein n=1 Tax=Corynebacterium TaxID=1716 RepID=UPI002579F2FD|nr:MULTISPECIES: RhuM family protein [Corynebacterium]